MIDWDALKPYLPPVAGAALAALRQKDKNYVERIISFLVGFCIAFYGAEPTIEYFNLTEKYVGGIGFALGYFGLALSDGILSSDWAAIIKERLSK